jgi:hypothetical protein
MEAALDEPAHDERMRRLQRIAYGAVASNTERTAALAELEALRREHGAGEADGADGPPLPLPPLHPGRANATAAPTRASLGLVEPGASRGDAVKPLKWAIAVGTTALLIGVAVGWQVAARMSTSAPSAAAVATVPAPDGLTVPVDQASVARLFETPPSPADVPHSLTPDPRIAPADYRLLVTRSDGVALHVARQDGGTEICAVLAIPGVFTSGSCTRDGRFPEGGLRVEAFVEGDLGLIRGTIHPNGTAELTPTGYVPGPVPVAEG